MEHDLGSFRRTSHEIRISGDVTRNEHGSLGNVLDEAGGQVVEHDDFMTGRHVRAS
jgi:hypothetical protein